MTTADNTHEKRRALAEQTLDHYAKGDQEGGDRRADQAVEIDPEGVGEVVQDLDEDAKATGKTG